MKSYFTITVEFLKRVKEKILIDPLLTSFVVFIICTSVVVTLTLFTTGYDLGGILTEAHGMLLDILIIGVFILALDKAREKRQLIQRYKDEIDDFRGWETEEAMFRIVGNIKRLNKMNISDINLFNCYLRKANLREANLQKANLRFANLQEAILTETNLQETDLTGAKLQEAILTKANLQEADLFQAKLQETDLTGAKLQEAILTKANLREADLSKATLREANLGSAYLQGANFQEADLSEATLRKADLGSTYLQGANLREADLMGCINVTAEQLAKAKTLFKAKLDDELRKEIEKKYPHLLEKPKEEV